ncbi:MAG: hypothetical protein IPF96_20745 [Rhodobacter sp.]|nr:hypothetical protein [Rhodobacter sp.]
MRNEPVTAETLGEVQSLSFGSAIAPQITDADIGLFQFLPRLGYVALDNTRGLTPEGLAQLADVPELWKLSLRDSEMTDAHMAVVAGLSRVRGLDLTMNGCHRCRDARTGGDAGVDALTLDATGITDAGMAALEGNRTLQILYFARTGVTDAAFVALGTIRTLQTLAFNDTPVNGSGFEHLGGLTGLQEMGMMNTAVDNVAVWYLTKVPSLKTVPVGHQDRR